MIPKLRNKKGWLIFLTILLIILLIASYFLFANKDTSADRLENKDQTVLINIDSGDGVTTVAQKLYEKDLIESKLIFYWQLASDGLWGKVKPGEYYLAKNTDFEDLMNYLTTGTPQQIKITIPEGWSLEKIDQNLAKKGYFKKGQFIEEVEKESYQKQFPFLSQKKNNDLEGYLFPDSYFLTPLFSPSQLVEKMLIAFENKVYNELKDDKLPAGLDSFQEAVILASIVEKEAQTKEDRRLVAGIFLKRLRNDKKLQACSTVNYLLDESKTVLKESDLSIDSSYNTYKIDGLPPSAICNPSLESVKAVYNPASSPYWYFLSDSNSKLYYSKTNQEHETKKARYLN